MREQIRVRVDSEQWERWRQQGESNTELLTRILENWQQLQQTLAALSEIDPNPSQALGRLLTSHAVLSTASITIHSSDADKTAPLIPSASKPEPAPTVSEQAANVAVIDGLENNGDDW